MINSSSITFYFKEIFPKIDDWTNFLTEFDITDLTNQENLLMAQKIYKYLFRNYKNSNIQFDTPDAFKSHLANLIEDIFEKYKMQLTLIQKSYELTSDEMEIISRALANTSANPNNITANIEKPLDYISNQAYTIAKTNKLQAYLRAINDIPTKLIEELILTVKRLFKCIIPTQEFYYKKGENL